MENLRIMLKIIYAMKDVNTEQLLAVYAQSNQQKGKRCFRNLSTEVQRLKAEDDFLSYLRDDFFRQPGAFYAVWIVNGVYRSAVRFEPFRDGLLLQALETEPAVRNHGYAGCLLSEVLEFLKSTGHNVIYSHVDKHNTASLQVHKHCGFQQILDYAVLIDGTVTQNSYTLSILL